MEPTKEQKQWFWEQFGFKSRLVWSDSADIVPRHQFKVWDYPDGSGVTQNLTANPPIDPNNLFKYAVPKIIKSADYSIIITQNLAQCVGYVRPMQGGKQYDAIDNQNPALALFWAIYKALGGE